MTGRQREIKYIRLSHKIVYLLLEAVVRNGVKAAMLVCCLGRQLLWDVQYWKASSGLCSTFYQKEKHTQLSAGPHIVCTWPTPPVDAKTAMCQVV